jgi:tetratricopeptide (TPR) repeat protein
VLSVLGDDEPALRVRVLLVAASGEYYSRHDERRRLAEEALQLARREGDPELIATALLARIRADWHHHDLADKRRWTDELLGLGLDHHLPEIELLGWVHRMAWAQTSGDVDEAEQAHRRAVSLAERLGLVIHQAQLGWAAPTFARARGDAEEAARRLATARELHTRTRLYSLDVMTAWNRVTAAWDAGSLHDITDEEREAFAEVFPEGEVALRLRDGNRAGARSLLEQVLVERPLQPLFDALGLAVIRASLVADLEAVDLAPALLAELEPYPTYLGALGTCCTTWPVALELGRLQSLLGDHAAAVATLEAGLARADDAGWLRWAERIRAALAEVRERATPTAVTATGA